MGRVHVTGSLKERHTCNVIMMKSCGVVLQDEQTSMHGRQHAKEQCIDNRLDAKAACHKIL